MYNKTHIKITTLHTPKKKKIIRKEKIASSINNVIKKNMSSPYKVQIVKVSTLKLFNPPKSHTKPFTGQKG